MLSMRPAGVQSEMGQGFWNFSYYTMGTLVRGAWPIKVTGREHVPRSGPAILASNHLSYSDHYFMPSVIHPPRQVFFISKSQHFDNRVQAWWFRQLGVIPLKRGASDQDAFNRSVEVLREGNLYCIYPEGTRSPDGRLYKGHTGVARLALLTGAPVIPVGMVGTDRVLPKGSMRLRHHPVEVHFGAPMTFPQHAVEDAGDRKITREITDGIVHAIRDLTRQEYVDAYAKVADYEKKEPETAEES